MGENQMSEEILKAVKQIAFRFQPERIVLFGSYAYGQPTKDSDVELFICLQTDLKPYFQATEIREAVDFPFPVDLLVRTPQQLRDRLRLGDPFIKEIITRGKLLYESSQH